MARLGEFLSLVRCPHCGIASPALERRTSLNSAHKKGVTFRKWEIYECRTCGGMTMAVAPYALVSSREQVHDVSQIWPTGRTVSDAVPERARQLLIDSLQSPPTASIMASASALDWMLKAKGYVDGSLYERIDQSAADHLLTEDMKEWAHEIRLDANDQRHADEHAPAPTDHDKSRILEFTLALAEILFEFPARVKRGRDETKAAK